MIWFDSHHTNTMTINRPAMFMRVLEMMRLTEA
jgi:hypothetical protein